MDFSVGMPEMSVLPPSFLPNCPFYSERNESREGSRLTAEEMLQTSDSSHSSASHLLGFGLSSVVVSNSAPVMPFKFSKEKFWLEPPSENLRKQLEEELRLSGTYLKSHAWYHGPIPWEVCSDCMKIFTFNSYTENVLSLK